MSEKISNRMENGWPEYLADALADIVRLQRKELTLYREVFDMENITHYCRDILRCLTKERMLSCMWLGRMEGVYVGDERRIRQLILSVIGSMLRNDKSMTGIRIDVAKEELGEWKDLFIICFRNMGFRYDTAKAGREFEESLMELAASNSIAEAMGGSIRLSFAGTVPVITLKFALERREM